jgi:hypothetical protein
MLAEEYLNLIKSLIQRYGRNYVAELLNCSDSLISNILAGRRNISVERREILEKYIRDTNYNSSATPSTSL